ncbi:MerR family transcriptional regulator [Plantactinospora soyae]|uniref:DNA-binding transcriptional MerR regulator n=1 Tax=Plantactinospora soyae TaxID=1544732 RepID=A0A927MCG5_9ACTN|nr:MerR family transcriptional regulator [Plantactinospora soyae]MBE1489248.1 DNA-binding transcriptional MerR regulator [Plantactinospora soyae]
MAWSTRALAALVGTTMNTIRHYRLGLLEEPERRYNGYKQYGAGDLVRLRCIGRLADPGVPLFRIGEVGGNIAADALSQVDTDPVGHDIDVVQPDADEATRRGNLAERLAPILARHLVDHPRLSDPAADLSKSGAEKPAVRPGANRPSRIVCGAMRGYALM